jgi:integrase
MISNDNINTDKHRWKIDYIDRISMYLLLNSGKKDIWEINQQDLNAILTNISQLEYKKDSLRSPIKALFNCSASDVLCWWRSAFLGQEENMLGDTRLTTPPRVEISSKSLLKTDSVEERLKFALSKLDNSENIQAQIINVYKKNYFKESYHGLVQVKISEFMKYYNFCKDESFDCTKTENIRKYIEGKCFGKSNNYRNKIVNALRGYFKEAISCGYYASNPVKYYLNVESTKYAIIPDDKVIPNHDMKRIFLILNQLTEFEALFIRLLYHTGLRIGEVLYLTVGCVVEITPNVITLAVAPFKQREKPMLVMIEDIEAFEVVKQLVALRSRYGRLPHYKTNQLGLWLLTRCDDDGRGIVHLNPKMANAIISKACVLAGVKNYTNHCFRHSFAHRKLNDEKYDLEDVSLLLGHSCIDTVKIYTKLTNEEKLIYFSRILARRNAVKKYSETYKELKVNFEKHEYRITTNDCHNRWHGKGFCSTKETEACPVRHLSCYTCFLYKPDIKKVGEMKCDYVANYQLLNQELNKEFPILKDVILFSNILSAISGHLATLGVKDEILLSDKPVLDLAEKYIKEMK